MAEVFCVCRQWNSNCGQWNSNESLLWEFSVDRNRNASSIYLEENLLYEDLIKMVSEDFSVEEEKICWSYGISLDLKSIVEGFPPVSIGNTRQLRSFIGNIRAFDGMSRLCVKVCMIFFN
ncbi:hypothetical protein Bca4012_013172 [Brassica carinata]